MLYKILAVILVFALNIVGKDIGSHAEQLAAQPAANGPLTMPDFEKMFKPDVPLLEIFVRGSVTYLTIFLLLRVVLKREAGTLAMSDLLVVVMLADAVQNGMAGDYKSITDGILLVITIIGWSHFLNFLGYYFPAIQKFIHPQALLLIKNGILQKANLRKELITQDELMGQLREQGVDSIEKVKEAFMESDGRISIIAMNEKKSNGNKKPRGS
jgi:uncharacterized membrane protein YcaP (DUF421 family)